MMRECAAAGGPGARADRRGFLPEDGPRVPFRGRGQFRGEHEGDESRTRRRRRRPCVYHLHVGLHRPTERRDDFPRAICNHMAWMQAEFPLSAADRVLQKTPISFDASVWEFYAPLISGAQLVLAQPGGHRDSRDLNRWCGKKASRSCSLCRPWPRWWRRSRASRNARRCAASSRAARRSRRALCEVFRAAAGMRTREPLRARRSARLIRHSTAARAGETWCRSANRWRTRGCSFWTNGSEPVRPGVAGELHIGSAQLARGYWNNAELTAREFVTPKRARLQNRRPRALADAGEVEFLGRADDQVKIRGHRIELGEIESALEAAAGRARRARSRRTRTRAARSGSWPTSRRKTRAGSSSGRPRPARAASSFSTNRFTSAMSNDRRGTTVSTKRSSARCAGKVVIDIGTGKDAILARLAWRRARGKCMRSSFWRQPPTRRRRSCASLRLDDHIIVVQGDVRTLQLPEQADVCVSENIGHVGGAEGWDLILARRAHLLKPGAPMIPARCETRWRRCRCRRISCESRSSRSWRPITRTIFRSRRAISSTCGFP